MAIDFPNSPTVGQIFTAANGTSWQWTGTVWVAAGTATGLITGAPNKLINPFMEIDQANEGAGVALNGAYPVDGFKSFMATTSGAAGNSGRSIAGTAPAGYQYSMFTQITTGASSVGASDQVSIYQTIEADDLLDTRFGTASAQTVAVSFWALCTIASTYYLSLRNAAATRSYVVPFTISAANTWQLFTVVIPGDTAGTWVTSGNAAGMFVTWAPAVGTTFQTTPNTWQAGNYFGGTGMSNAYLTTTGAIFRLGPCGLWVAPAAQPLLRTSFQAELARCQRYYEKSYNAGVRPGTAVGTGAATGGWFGNGTAAQLNMGAPVAFKVAKRATPTTTIYDNAGTAGNMSWYSGSAWNNGLSAGAGGPGPSQSWMAVTQLTGGAVYYYNFDWVADARL